MIVMKFRSLYSHVIPHLKVINFWEQCSCYPNSGSKFSEYDYLRFYVDFCLLTVLGFHSTD